MIQGWRRSFQLQTGYSTTFIQKLTCFNLWNLQPWKMSEGANKAKSAISESK